MLGLESATRAWTVSTTSAAGHAAAQQQGGVGVDGGQEAGVLAQAAAQRLLGLLDGAAAAQDLGQGHERAVGAAADGRRVAAGPVAHLAGSGAAAPPGARRRGRRAPARGRCR